MIAYKEKPFYLNDEDIEWVEQTLASMTLEEKIAQMFCVTDMITDPEALKAFVRKYPVGSFMYRSGDAAEVQNAQRAMQEASKIPLLLACNLESGGNGIAATGTFFGRQLEAAAARDPKHAYRLGMVCAKEGGATGCNWSFAPIVDIDYNWRNPITNVRTWGSDPDTVIRLSEAYMDGVKDSGETMAVTIKHFPGDGVDERDQHLLSSVNSLSAEDWENTYGRVYQTLIDKGAQTVMVGHILQPEMTRKMCPGIRDEEIFPASTNKYLITDLLREKMGFNGLVATDATPMVGFSGFLTRREAVAKSIMAGADMIMFCKNIDEDFAGVKEDIENGTISIIRVNEAIRRQLALKASLGLHKSKEGGTIVPGADALSVIGCAEHIAWAKECADEAITLVKDNQNLLPLSPNRTKRVRLTVLGEGQGGSFGDGGSITMPLKEALEKEGFEVALYDYVTMERGEIFTAGAADMKAKFDLSIVAANVATGSNNTTRRLDWITLMAANEPWYTREIPTMFLSFCNPYHMIDVPFISTFVNCYSSNQFCVGAAVEKLMGRSEFKGVSPVDPWCGDVWGAKFM